MDGRGVNGRRFFTFFSQLELCVRFLFADFFLNGGLAENRRHVKAPISQALCFSAFHHPRACGCLVGGFIYHPLIFYLAHSFLSGEKFYASAIKYLPHSPAFTI